MQSTLFILLWQRSAGRGNAKVKNKPGGFAVSATRIIQGRRHAIPPTMTRRGRWFLINTRLQPGGSSWKEIQPLQRFSCVRKTVETVFVHPAF
jgi:hypothetical protein